MQVIYHLLDEVHLAGNVYLGKCRSYIYFRICVYVSFIGGSVFWKMGGTCEGFSEPACPAQPFFSQPGRKIKIDKDEDGGDNLD